MPSICIIARTSDNLAQSGTTEILHGYRGAVLKRHGMLPPNKTSDTDERLSPPGEIEEPYCALICTPDGGLIDVSPRALPQLATFLDERKNALVELDCIVVIVSPDLEAQHNSVALLNAIVPASIEPGKCHVLLVDCPRNTPTESAFAELFSNLHERQLEGLIVPTVMNASRAFEEAQVHQLSVSALMNGADIEGEFRAAREKGVREKRLLAFGRRLMAARTVVAAAREFGSVYDALGLPRIQKTSR
ncbi:hypothetical protein VOI32_05770 [Paraburkholderia caribensis]|uniref:ParA family protein n=1 Tax=Paraburkholderia caribensis TaxID=75105 RepID=A0ABV0DQR6_9BURK|nr:hypothetical protein [Paraburkholderia caribensis]MCO4876559.1 hypothetical protein [Paraburkholderia caribensis]